MLDVHAETRAGPRVMCPLFSSNSNPNWNVSTGSSNICRNRRFMNMYLAVPELLHADRQTYMIEETGAFFKIFIVIEPATIHNNCSSLRLRCVNELGLHCSCFYIVKLMSQPTYLLMHALLKLWTPYKLSHSTDIPSYNNMMIEPG
jgi:hypothetical protein